ncbi:hypothetical protein BJ165DRAFT_1534475 [Panaeolus papilionaceus]|nr:hypothetical protein BJ165DRAFT_1534475 [Panaeolus papilionaceus]
MATEVEFGENEDAFEPSENWDDDFEFDPSSSSANTASSSPKTPRRQGAGSGRGRGLNSNAHAHYTRKMSIASSAGLSMVEDWDTDSVMGGGVGNVGLVAGGSGADADDNWDLGATTSTPGAGGSGSGVGTPGTPRTPRTPRTPVGKAEEDPQVPHSQHVEQEDTENWDDDFEDGSPRKPGLTTSRLQPASLLANSSSRRRRVSREGENEESWDDEYEDSADEDGANDFGFHDKEEDRTVTAKSRRAALASSSSRSPPLPPPPLPPPIPMSTSRLGHGPFHIPTSQSYYDNPQPFPAPRSPSSSVFSVPNTIYSQSNSHNSNGSTSHLRPSSAFALLPPSPEIHHMRQRGRGRAEVFASSKMGGGDAKDGKERRRLRKKSRPVPDGTFELKDVVSSLPSRPSRDRERDRYSFSDAEGELNIHGAYPSAHGRDTPASAGSMSDLSSGHDHGQGRPHARRSDGLPRPPESDNPVPQTPRKQSTGPGSTLLSRIGSVKKWGVRRRSRGVSAAPENRQEVAISPDSQTHPTSQPTSPDEPHHDRGKTSRPQSSRSSNAHTHSQRNSISINPSASGSPSSNNWFFRGGSSSKHAPSDDRVSHGSPPVTVHRSGSVGGASHRSRSRSRTGSRGGTARDGTGKVASPLSHHGSSPNILNGKPPSSIGTSTSMGGLSRKSMDSAGDVRFPAGDTNVDNTSPSPYNRPMSTTATPDIYATPSKLVKRKSLGFVQLRRGLSTSRSQVSGYTSPERDAAKGKKKEDESDLEGAGESSGGRYGMLGMGRVGRPASKAPTEGEGSGERTRRKSFSRLLIDRGDKDKTKEKEKDGGGTMSVPMTPTKADTPSSKDGSRGFMGSVRRISLVGRHRRMKSGGVPVSNASPPSSARSSSVSRPPLPTSSQSRHHQQGRGNLPYTLPPLPGTGSNISLRFPSGSNVDLPSMMRLVSINSSASGRSGEESLRPASTVSISASSRQVSATSVAGATSDAEEGSSRRYGDLRTARPRRSSRSGSRSVSRTGEQGRSSGEVTRKVSTHSKRTSIIGMDFSPPSHSSSSFGSSSEDIPPLPRIASRTSQDIQRPVTPPYSKPSSPRTPSSSTLPPATPSLPKTPTNMKTPTPKNIKPHRSPKTPSRVPPLPTADPDHPALPLLPPIELQPPSPPQTVKASSKTHGKAKRSLDVAFESLRFELNAEQEREGRPSFGSLRVDDQDTTKGEGVSPATSTSSVFYTPKSSPKPGASPQKPKTAKPTSPVGASLSPGRGVGAGQSASLGRTSGIDVSPSRVSGVAVSGGGGEAEKEKEKAAHGWKRRNSLGDLKIPARISQAQVGLRRDLGMVREFAGSVEQLKDLQSTYYTLISEVQGVLDSYAQLHAQQAQEAARSASPHSDPRKSPTGSSSPVPRSTSPSFLSSLNLRKGRSRSNTVSSTTSLHAALSPTSESTNQASQVPDVPLVVDDKKQAYKDLAAAFYSLNSRYKITLECAELLIDLGGSSSGGTTTGPSAAVSSGAQTTSPVPLPAQHTGQQSTDGDPTLVTKRSRERAITLAGDESKHAVLVQAVLPLSTSVPYTSPLNSYPPPTTSPSTTSQPAEGYTHNSWRASTGRHDLSQRQLVLLREMLNNSNVANAVADEGLGVVEEGTPVPSPNPISPPPPLTLPVSATSTYDSGPQTAPLPSSASAPYGEGQMIVNWDWRWGDPRNSTITLPSPSEEAALHSKFAEIVTRDKEKEREREREKKRRSTRLGMSGIRDMLRALKRTADAQITTTISPGSGNTLPPPPMPVHYHSTTSLSTESSASAGRSQVAAATTKGSRPSSRARYPLPIPRMPSLSHTHSSGNSNPSGTTGRRRAKTSTGPESMRGPEDAGWNANGTAPSFVPPKPSPRRPSLASIFRIGKSSEKTQQAQHQQQQTQQQIASPTMSPEPLYSASTYASTGAASQDNHSSSAHPNPSAEPYAPGELDGDLSNTSIETSDWDPMDSASDLDAAAKALSRSSGPNKLSKFKHVKKGKSPYLFMRGGDDKKGNGNGSGKEGVSSSSSVFVAGQSQELLGRIGNQSQTGLVTKRSFCASQGSLLETAGGSAAAGVPQRMTRLSGVEEMRDHEHEHEQVLAQAAVGEKDPPFSASSTRSSAHRRVSSGSRPSSSRSTRSPIYSSAAQGQPQNHALSQAQKTGSVRSMPPHLTASTSLPPMGGSQRPVSGPYPSSSSAHPYATASGRHGQHHHHHHHHQAHAAATHGGDVNIRLAMTPENIKPLLENAREVLVRLVECIDEVKALSGRCKELVDDVGGQRGVVQQEAVVS